MTDQLDSTTYIDLRIAHLQDKITHEHAAGEARAHINATMVNHVEENLKLRFELNDRAMVLASASIDKRLESMNEFREQLNHQAGQFVTRVEVEDKIATILKGTEVNGVRLNSAEGKMSNLEGKIWAVGASFGVVVTIINIALHFIK